MIKLPISSNIYTVDVYGWYAISRCSNNAINCADDRRLYGLTRRCKSKRDFSSGGRKEKDFRECRKGLWVLYFNDVRSESSTFRYFHRNVQVFLYTFSITQYESCSVYCWLTVNDTFWRFKPCADLYSSPVPPFWSVFQFMTYFCALPERRSFWGGGTSLNWVRSCHEIGIYLCVSSQAEQTKKKTRSQILFLLFKKRRVLTDRQTCCTAGWGVIQGKWFVYSHMIVGYIVISWLDHAHIKGLDGLCFLVWYFWHGAPTFIKVSVACCGFYSKLGDFVFQLHFLNFRFPLLTATRTALMESQIPVMSRQQRGHQVRPMEFFVYVCLCKLFFFF